MELSNAIKAEIKEFIKLNMVDFHSDADEYGYLEITFATNDEGNTWNYQTGDNSFTGACYSLPHWAVTSIYSETTVNSLYTEIIAQLTDLLPENR